MTALKYRSLMLVFIISGFTGLIYESIWSHYLKLFLGHAAYSQALVLAIFMGGMAAGAWISGNVVTKKINLLVCYALVEFLIGIMGIIFHTIFQATLDLSFNHVIPLLNGPLSVMAYKWTLGSVLILPQSILLGMTFPLMSNGLMRVRAEMPGHTISWLYFANSIGAAVGVLYSGFYLIAKIGIPGTILTAGVINILIAILVYYFSRDQYAGIPLPQERVEIKLPRVILWASLLTGTASFIYELVWLRMLSMVMGASTHSFEIMLSAFIAGLALGGLWIRKIIDQLRQPLYFAAFVQIIMALIAISTLILYNHTFDFMSYLLHSLARNEGGYTIFLLGSYGIAILVMMPTAFMAGMTLPLFSLILIHNKYGEKSISHVYVYNMLGAISAVIFMLLFGFVYFGIKGSILVGAGIDFLLGLYLLRYVPKGKLNIARAAAGISILLFCGIAVFSDLDTRRMTSGVFRSGNSSQPENTEIRFHQDGRTSSVSVIEFPDSRQILLTNGKPDASIYRDLTVKDRSLSDEITQVMLGALPLAIHPEAEKVAVIGIGSGMTSHTILGNAGIKLVDSIEIEREMLAGAQLFRPRTERLFTDPRSQIYIEDAKTFFSVKKGRYDLVIAEPSNPWVSGVSSLYSEEFYKNIRASISDDGYLVQWLHLYELNDDLFLTVLEALSGNFSDYAIYSTNSWDIIILARKNGRVDKPSDRVFSDLNLAEDLSIVGINSLDDIRARFLANRWLLDPLLETTTIPANSDYFPVLDLYAVKHLFMKDQVKLLTQLRTSPVPFIRFLYPEFSPDAAELTRDNAFNYSLLAKQAEMIYQSITASVGTNTGNKTVPEKYQLNISYLLETVGQCNSGIDQEAWVRAFFPLVTATIPYLENSKLAEMFNVLRPQCPDDIGTIRYLWFNLVDAAAEQDFPAIVDYTGRLLGDEITLSGEYMQYLVTMKLVALFILADDLEFKQTMDTYYKKYFRGETPVSIDIMLRHVSLRNPGL